MGLNYNQEMVSLSEEDEHFFETKEYMTSLSDSGSEGVEISDSESKVVDGVVRNFGYDIWVKCPETVSDRRQRLLKLMGLVPNDEVIEDDKGSQVDEEEKVVDGDRTMEHSNAVLRLSSRDFSLSSRSSISYCSSETQELLDRALDENLVCRIKNLDDGSEFIVDELGQDGLLRRLREVGSNRLVSGEEFERMLGVSPLVQRVMGRDVGNVQASSNLDGKRRTKRGWLRRLGVVAHVQANRSFRMSKGAARNVRVKTYKKQLKELSALYLGQDIIGNDGAILTMKFSPDGKLLASSGEDGVVRIWQWTQSERTNHNVSDIDLSNVYFKVNDLGELVPINIDKEKRGRLKSLRKSSESACVIFPQKVYGLAETPLHEFHGHEGEVLDLSWSNNKCLLSSSVDKTVRLWRVGVKQCLRVFSHNTFVTCIQFNPMDENYFISGSIDGKIRIWTITRCEVVDWTDIKEIVTAVCYQPDGKGAVVGSISGECCFYDTLGNRLRMTNQTSLHGKKKSSFRRITGFQFSPSDHSKLMVTSADSQVRILKGSDVICKYKGLRNAGSQIAASFTSDGTHIVSASEDSSVYMWDCAHSNIPITSSKVPRNKACERFFSNNASVAIPWCGPSCVNTLPSLSGTSSGIRVKYATAYGGIDTSAENLQYPFSRGVATWPEEKLTSSNSLVLSSGASKSEFKFLKTTCQNMNGSPHTWGLVIVTAGWDGRIRVFQNYGLPVRL